MAFGLVVVGFGDSTGFGTSKVVVPRFLTGFGASKVVGVRFSMGFGASKVVGGRIWGWLGCLSLVLGFCRLSRGGGWRFVGFGRLRADVARLWVETEAGGRLRRFRGYRLAWGGDVASEWVVGGGQAVGNGAGSGWGLPSRLWGRNDGDVAP